MIGIGWVKRVAIVDISWMSIRRRFAPLRWHRQWRWFSNKLCEAAEVPGNGCQHELLLCAAWTAKAEASEPQHAFQMREPHLNVFTVVA
jgi:hypothetical protein